MSDLPNIFYKKTDTAEELHKVIEHLQARVVEVLKQNDVLRKDNASLDQGYKALKRAIQAHVRDEERLAKADQIYEIVGVLKAIWEGV